MKEVFRLHERNAVKRLEKLRKGNHREIIGRLIGEWSTICEEFRMVFLGKDMAESSGEVFWFVPKLQNFYICFWENPQTPHLYDFGISGRDPEPRNQYYVFLERPGYIK